MSYSRVAQTSLEAYEDKQRNGSLRSDRQQILSLIHGHGGICIWEAALLMGKLPNEISGRFSELQDQGLIRKSETVLRVNPRTLKRAHVWLSV